MIASNDTPVTNKELDSFYGTAPTQAEIYEAILRQKRAFDADDLVTIAQEYGDELVNHLGHWKTNEFALIFLNERNKMIADRASIELYGRVGVIKPEKV